MPRQSVHHVLCPVISIASYIIVEKHAGSDWIWLPVALTFTYGMVMLYLNGIRKVDGPYPFFLRMVYGKVIIKGVRVELLLNIEMAMGDHCGKVNLVGDHGTLQPFIHNTLF